MPELQLQNPVSNQLLPTGQDKGSLNNVEQMESSILRPLHRVSAIGLRCRYNKIINRNRQHGELGSYRRITFQFIPRT